MRWTVGGTAVPRGSRRASQRIAPPSTTRCTVAGPCAVSCGPVVCGKPNIAGVVVRESATRLPPAIAQACVTGEAVLSIAMNVLPFTTVCAVVPSLRASSTRCTPSATTPKVTVNFGVAKVNGPVAGCGVLPTP